MIATLAHQKIEKKKKKTGFINFFTSTHTGV
jgi:hypothetical protein